MMGCAIRWAVEARKKGRGPEKEQRRREEPLEEMRTEGTDEPEVTGVDSQRWKQAEEARVSSKGGGRT